MTKYADYTMTIMNTAPIFTESEAINRDVYLALMWAFSYPGRAQTLPVAVLPGQALAAIGSALLDLETSYYTPDAALEVALRRTTSRPVPIQAAEYIFYPTLTDTDLDHIAQASAGEMLFPDRAATLIIGCQFGDQLGKGTLLTLSGPGVNGNATLHISGLPDAFWELRSRTRRYPLGWDIFLVDGAQIIGLPRSTSLAW